MPYDYKALKPQIIAEASESDLPEWLCLVPDGVVNSTHGTFLLDADGADTAIAEFDRRGVELCVDYEHHSVGGQYAAPDGKAVAAGWIDKLEYRAGKGLFGHVRWTPQATRHLLAGEYRYLSPVIAHEDKPPFRVRAILSAALTNNPAINNMAELVRLAAKRLGVDVMADDAQGGATGDVTTNQDAPAEGEDRLEQLMAQARSLLDLPEDADMVAVLEALIGLFAEEGGGEEPTAAAKNLINLRATLCEKLDLRKNASLTSILKAVGGLQAGKTDEVAALKAKVGELEREANEAKARALVAGYVTQGKVTKAQEDHFVKLAMTDRPMAVSILDAQAVQVPQGTTGAADGGTDDSTPTTKLKDVVLKACRAYEQNAQEIRNVCTRSEWVRDALRQNDRVEADLDDAEFEKTVAPLMV